MRMYRVKSGHTIHKVAADNWRISDRGALWFEVNIPAAVPGKVVALFATYDWIKDATPAPRGRV